MLRRFWIGIFGKLLVGFVLFLALLFALVCWELPFWWRAPLDRPFVRGLLLRAFVRKVTLQNRLPAEVRAALHKAGHATLYSLDSYCDYDLPFPSSSKSISADLIIPDPLTESERFRSQKVLGKVELNPSQLEKVVHDMEKAASNWNGGIRKAFTSHLGLRVVWQERTYDLLLGYEDGREIRVYRDGNEDYLASVGVSGSSENVDKILSAAGIQLKKTK